MTSREHSWQYPLQPPSASAGSNAAAAPLASDDNSMAGANVADLTDLAGDDHISEVSARGSEGAVQEELVADRLGLAGEVPEVGQELRRTVSRVTESIESGNRAMLWEAVRGLHETDLASVIEQLSARKQLRVISDLGSAFNFRALGEIEYEVRDKLVAKMPVSALWRAAGSLEPEDAADLLSDLPAEDVSAILDHLPPKKRWRIERLLQYDEDTAGRIMRTNIVAIPARWNVGQAVDYARDRIDLPPELHDIFVLGEHGRVEGRVPVGVLLSARRAAQVREVMRTDLRKVSPLTPAQDIAQLFDKYRMSSLAVVDEHDKVIGEIDMSDAVDLVQEELEDDIRNLTGVRGAYLGGTAWKAARSRVSWLILNLLTAGIAALVVGFFAEQIKVVVALAVLLPVVPSVAGNAGIQTLTLMVRAIADRSLDTLTITRLIARELATCALIGSIITVIAAAPVYLWFGDWYLVAAMAAALLLSVVVAGLSGVAVPLILQRVRFDPAVASPIFLTMITDVTALASFLGVGTALLYHPL